MRFMPIQRTSLNVSLTPGLSAFIAAELSSGRYQTASEVVRAALRGLQEIERMKPKPTVDVPPRVGSQTCETGA